MTRLMLSFSPAASLRGGCAAIGPSMGCPLQQGCPGTGTEGIRWKAARELQRHGFHATTVLLLQPALLELLLQVIRERQVSA